MNVGDEWTYGETFNGSYRGSNGVKITSVPAPPDYPLGTIYENGTATEFNQMIDEKYLFNETMITELEANYTTKTRTYAGVSCECVYLTDPNGYAYIDTATGILVETYFSGENFLMGHITVHKWIISWSVTDIPKNPEEPSTGGGDDKIPGYDILFIIGLIAIISTVLTIGFKKKFKT